MKMVQQYSSFKMIGSTLPLLMMLNAVCVTIAQNYAPLMEDNVAIRTDVKGLSYADPKWWVDSYSDGNSCYCLTTFDHDVGVIQVDTPLGPMSIKAVCELLGDGPRGSEGRPRYNDIQCGNGPANNFGDEVDCPGRVEYGALGCKHIGPKWNFAPFIKVPISSPVRNRAPTKAPTKAPTATKRPTRAPTTKRPIRAPTTKRPTKAPTKRPTKAPTKRPTKRPTSSPTLRTRAPTKTPTPVCKITQLDIWDGATDTIAIPKMFDGMNVCTSLELNVDAVTGVCVKYVKYALTGSDNYTYRKDEYNAPFFLFGNVGQLVNSGKLLEGSYTLIATPNDVPEAATTIKFNVIKC